MRGRAGAALGVIVAGALCACGSSDALDAVSTLPPAHATPPDTSGGVTPQAPPSTGSAPSTIVVDTTPPPPPPATTQPTVTRDNGTVPALDESADVVTLELDHAGTTLTAKFGTSSAGWALVKVFADGALVAGAGTPSAATLEEAGAVAMLADGAVVIALVGSPGQSPDGLVLYAGDHEDDESAALLDDVVTGTWTAYDARLLVLAVMPAGTTRLDVDGLTANTGIIYEVPTDPTMYFPPEANQARQ